MCQPCMQDPGLTLHGFLNMMEDTDAEPSCSPAAPEERLPPQWVERPKDGATEAAHPWSSASSHTVVEDVPRFKIPQQYLQDPGFIASTKDVVHVVADAYKNYPEAAAIIFGVMQNTFGDAMPPVILRLMNCGAEFDDASAMGESLSTPDPPSGQ